jgi:nucleoside-triphosphatase THEP1
MHAPHLVLAHEDVPAYDQTVAAIVYVNDAYPEAIFNSLVDRCRKAGLSLAGALQHPVTDGAGRRCDVLLEDLGCGRCIPLLADRGAGARGCRLDESALAEATAAIEASLERRPQLLVLSKFGKVECEGGGFRDLIARAVSSGIPVVIGVPRRNLDAWRLFAGEFAVELDINACEVERWLVEATIRPEPFSTG